MIRALGKPRHIAIGSVRFSLGRDNSPKDVIDAGNIFIEVVEKLRCIAQIESSLERKGCVLNIVKR